MGRSLLLSIFPADKTIRRGVVTYILCLLAIAGFTLTANWLIDSMVQVQEATARVVNLSGRQRMLSQRIAAASLQEATGVGPSAAEAQAELLAAIAEMRSSHEALVGGSTELRIPRPSREIARLYAGKSGIDGDVRDFLIHAQTIASRPVADAATGRTEGWRGSEAGGDADLDAVQAAARGPVLEALNGVVAAYQAESEARLGYLHRMLIWTTVAFVLVTLAQGLLLYHPLFRDMARLQGELREAARTDPLTGCRNRRAIAEEAGRLFARARRYGSPVAVLMVDADHFKQINDNYGHDAGDLVIQGLVGVMLRNVREMDVVGRMGGEEFAVLLPESGLIAAMLVARRICRAVAAERVQAGKAKTASISVTVSIGVAVLRDEDSSLFDALDRADRMLYQAKANGRNRVEGDPEAVDWEAAPA